MKICLNVSKFIRVNVLSPRRIMTSLILFNYNSFSTKQPHAKVRAKVWVIETRVTDRQNQSRQLGVITQSRLETLTEDVFLHSLHVEP